MVVTVYESAFRQKFLPTKESLAFLFTDFDRLACETDSVLWRLLIAQSLDFYQTNLKWGTLEDAKSVYMDEPVLTGHPGVDAAAAGIVLYVANRDGWKPPLWATNPKRKAENPWYVVDRALVRKIADKETPEQFRKLNVFITLGALQRL